MNKYNYQYTYNKIIIFFIASRIRKNSESFNINQTYLIYIKMYPVLFK